MFRRTMMLTLSREDLVRRITFHEGMVKGLAFDPAGEFLASQVIDDVLRT